MEYFELRRQIDNLVYQFDQVLLNDGTYGYMSCNADLWITKEEKKGWIAVGPITGDIVGRPWFVLPEDQLDYTPEGDWVSKKGTKTYVYSLIYSPKPEQP